MLLKDPMTISVNCRFQNRRTKWRRQVAEEREEERRATRMYETRHYIVRPDISY